MQQINVSVSPKGIYSCNIGVSTEEWQKILSNPDVTTSNYKDALMAFYDEPDHKSTCKILSLKHYRNADHAQKYNSLITNFGKAVVKYLNRFHIIDIDGTEKYWHVSMASGEKTEDGLFMTTLRPEIIKAIEKLGWNKKLNWIPFYQEMADKLSQFKDDRASLLDIVYKLDKNFVGYIKAQDGGHASDIDPFTVLGIFNRGITNDNRIKICLYFKEKLKIESQVPSDFDGIPVLYNVKSLFYRKENEKTDIQPLWNLFLAVLANNKQEISKCFDMVSRQKSIKWNITMGLYWIRPYDYISLDSFNRIYIPKLGIEVFKDNKINSTHYFSLLDSVKSKIENKLIKEKCIPEISYNAWISGSGKITETGSDKNNSIINKKEMPEMKYSKYIELLKEVHNLVLTGAPGTGKTYMAQEIAKEMGAEIKFVQFHPSYDYTDFVEGLRPIDNGNGQIGFERRDGVFKELCKNAIKNIADSEKTVENLTKELSWQEKMEQFIEEAIENEKKFKTVNGSEFSISDFKGHTIVVHNEQNEKTTDVTVNADEILDLLTQEVKLNIVRDIRNHYGRKFGTQPDSYAFAIIKEIRAMKTKVSEVSANKVEKKPFILIIDEINRGETSKIFGELFYAIDPGYRGKKNVLVQTQYQNLISESDVFSKGFYVPDNVYILATMNDIDRSVESMDFAMRRRFAWHEVSPTDTQDMLDSLSCSDKAISTMNRLNKVISETEGLGHAYMIGASYFLKLKDNGNDFAKLWSMNIEPLLKEYLRGFRKASEMLDKFKAAYYNQEQESADTSDLINEEN